MSLKCYCQIPYCEDKDQYNGTCITPPNSYQFCFSLAQLLYNTVEKKWQEFRSYGCSTSAKSSFTQCLNNKLLSKFVPRNISCCHGEDHCNVNLYPTLRNYSTEDLNMFNKDDDEDYYDYYEDYHEDEYKYVDEFIRTPHQINYVIPVVILLTCVAMLLLITIIAFRKRIKIKCFKSPSSNSRNDIETEGEQTMTTTTQMNLPDFSDFSSGSGGGPLSYLDQRTIGKEIETVCSIGEGCYGEVFQGRWRDESFAVKVFKTTDDKSWKREKEIYQTVLLRHDNILNFIGADVRSINNTTQLLLITNFHPHGSLYDYLQINAIDKEAALSMIESIISGLNHLHSEIFGKNSKPAIAHRDIKSRNILVKNNLECCIADFGLAAKYSIENKVLDLGCNTKVGTMRYISPEALMDEGKIIDFRSLKQSDIYSFSLVTWEILRRCSFDDHKAEDYQQPYYDSVPIAPSEDDMFDCICVNGIRPQIEDRWSNDSMLKKISDMLNECWHPSPTVRLSSLRIKKNLIEIRELLDK